MLVKMTIERFEDDRAILKSDDGARAVWPRNKLPAELSAGLVLTFDIGEEKELMDKNKRLAKDILNELLNANS